MDGDSGKAMTADGLHAAGQEPVITLSLADLLPDANGEIVVVGDGMHLSLVTEEQICGSGVAEHHLTATGMDVGGLNYFTFADGTKLYVSPDVDLTIASTLG